MFKADLTVESQTHSLLEIEALLGTASGPTGYSQGDPIPPVLERARQRSCWVQELDVADGTHPGTAALDAVIGGLANEFANRLADAHGQGCAVTLSILQEFSTDGAASWDFGLHLSATAVGWLARAHATLDIDQYLIH